MPDEPTDRPLPEGTPRERYGILELARLRKADGRRLILYGHHESGETGEEETGEETAQLGSAGGDSGGERP